MTDVLTDLTAETRIAWAVFVDAVHDGSGSAILEAYRAYWRTRRDAVAEYTRDPYTPTPAGLPRLDGNEGTLRAEYEWLAGWAPAYERGTVAGNAGNEFVRPLTAEERAEYERRAAAYPAAVEAFNASVIRYEQFLGRDWFPASPPNAYGFGRPMATPMGPPVHRRAMPELAGADDFSAALTAALQAEPSA